MSVSILSCRMLPYLCWLESLKLLFLSVRMRGRSSAQFWLRPRWSWTNWWRRSARLWRSPSLTGRPAGWPDRSVNSARREGGREGGLVGSFGTSPSWVTSRVPGPLGSEELKTDQGPESDQVQIVLTLLGSARILLFLPQILGLCFNMSDTWVDLGRSKCTHYQLWSHDGSLTLRVCLGWFSL